LTDKLAAAAEKEFSRFFAVLTEELAGCFPYVVDIERVGCFRLSRVPEAPVMEGVGVCIRFGCKTFVYSFLSRELAPIRKSILHGISKLAAASRR
jgi:hypothetical protein